jgi:stage II sporulation protein D
MPHRIGLYALGTAMLALSAWGQGAPARRPKLPTIRVLVTTAESATLESRGAVELVKPGWPRPLLSLPKLPSTVLAFKDGRFSFGGQLYDEKWLTLRALDPEGGVRLGERSYPGEIHFVPSGKGFQVVNEIDFEQYVLGVVPAEIGSGSPPEAMKVQAVAARSFAVGHMGGFREEKGRPVYDVVDDTRDQVYVGIPPPNTNLRRACEATSGMFVQYKGRFVTTYFSSSCGGHTMGVDEWSGAAAIPPLSGVPCGFCGEGAPNGQWDLRLPLADLTKKLKSRTSEQPVRGVSVLERTKSRRAATMLLDLGTRQLKLPAGEFASAIGARNTNFSVKVEGENVLVHGAGFGHGVGLCQVGTLTMAAKGRTFRQILDHYFPQHELAVLYGPQVLTLKKP